TGRLPYSVPPPGTRPRRSARARWALALAVAAALAPRPALAHAALTGAEPAPGSLLAAPPGAVALRFSEPVSAAGAGLTVLTPSGRPAARERARASGPVLAVPVAATEEGTYLVAWQVIAEDTHPSRGRFT